MITKLTSKPTLLSLFGLTMFALGAMVWFNPKFSLAATGCTALPTTKGAVTLSSVSVPSTGTYHVWSRIKTADTTNNSFLFQTDNNCNINVGDSASIPANTWTWVDYRDGNTATKVDVSLSAGTHPMEMAGREDNVLVDRVMLISDTCVPTGTGDNCVVASDTTPPTVSLTAPTSGATVSGSSVTVSANATDDTGVVGVQFKLDGSNLNSEDTTSPYSTTWDTTSIANGSHTLTAVARDIAGHTTTSSAVTVTVNNTVATCFTSSSSAWSNHTFAAQTSTFTFDFDVTPLSAPIDSVIGNSSGPAASYNDIATTVRFNASGNIDARNAGAYVADTVMPYSANITYHFKLTINPVAHTYSVVATPSGGAAVNLATNYGFRTSVATVSSLDSWSIFQDTTSAGSQRTCNAVIATASTGPKIGDLNGDNSVNITDLSLLLSSYNQNVTQCVTNNTYKCDLSSPGDGVVNIFDLSILLSHYGT
jgi:hypothetical protein